MTTEEIINENFDELARMGITRGEGVADSGYLYGLNYTGPDCEGELVYAPRGMQEGSEEYGFYIKWDSIEHGTGTAWSKVESKAAEWLAMTTQFEEYKNVRR
ncbi:MAG: hypothetical protein ACJAYB_000024 [Psychromonas sp.]|jgi:hypothetical protein